VIVFYFFYKLKKGMKMEGRTLVVFSAKGAAFTIAWGNAPGQ